MNRETITRTFTAEVDPAACEALLYGPNTITVSATIPAAGLPDGDMSAVFQEHGSSFTLPGSKHHGFTVDGPVLIKTAIVKDGQLTVSGPVRLAGLG